MKTTYHKLVRDRIPEIIEAGGGQCRTAILSDDEYLAMLDAKLDEELAEYHRDQNIEELADLLEVIYAAAAARGYTVEELEAVRAEKAEKRGGFARKILLIETVKESCMMKITEVVAALIWQGEQFMICQRPAHKARGLLWEFVGGKVEQGETMAAALIRECKEELAIDVNVGDIFMEVTHEYPDLTVHLTLFHASVAKGVPQMLEHNDIRWITPAEIPEYDFCPADVEILEEITKRYDKR